MQQDQFSLLLSKTNNRIMKKLLLALLLMLNFLVQAQTKLLSFNELAYTHLGNAVESLDSVSVDLVGSVRFFNLVPTLDNEKKVVKMTSTFLASFAGDSIIKYSTYSASTWIEKHHEWSGGVVSVKEHVSYYDVNGVDSIIVNFKPDGTLYDSTKIVLKNGKLDSAYVYDDKKVLSQKVVYRWSGSLLTSAVNSRVDLTDSDSDSTVFTYNSNELLIKAVRYSSDEGATWDAVVNTTFHWSSKDVGIDNLISEVNIYPNPTLGFLNVDNVSSFDYQVVTLDGRVVSRGVGANGGVDVSSLVAGSYVIVLATEEERFVGRFLKR